MEFRSVSVNAFTTTSVTFGKLARSVLNEREEVKLVAGSDSDAGSDAVTLAIRDLTEEIRKLRSAVIAVGLMWFDVKAGGLPRERVQTILDALEHVRTM